MKKKLPKFFDRIKVSHNKDFAANFRGSPYQHYLNDFVVKHTGDILGAVRKEFSKAAFIGYNPECFVDNIPPNVRLEKLFLCDPSVKNLEKSYELVDKLKHEKKMNFSIYPVCLEEEIWPFKDESLDLIFSSLNLQWTNDVHAALMRMLASLIPDGAMIGTIFGEDTVEELRMAFTLAENERSGGVSQHTSPMITAVDFGNLFARCGYNMPTIYADKLELLFDDAFQIMEFLQCMGENNALLNSRQDIQRELLLSVAAIYDSLFRSQRNPDKVYASFHIINFLGWKYHESQQKPKERGSAEFSLKVLQKELEESGDPTEGKITSQSGTIEVDESDVEEETPQEEKPKGNDGEGKK